MIDVAASSFLAAYDGAPSPQQKLGLLFQWIATKPLALFKELRTSRPILITPGGPVVLSMFADVEEALTRNLQFTVKPYAPKMDPAVGPFMLARDGTVYNQRDKGIMRALIQQTDMPGVRQRVARIGAGLIAQGASPDGRLELVSQVTRPGPIALTGQYFGFPGPDLTAMMRWSYATQNDMFHNLTNDPTVHQACVAAGAEMKAYLDDFLPRRAQQVKADPTIDDVVARMLRLQTPPQIGFDQGRILSNTMGLLVGGIETTSAAIVQAIDQLIDRPDQMAAAQRAAQANDDAAFDALFWEALRFNPMAPFVVRLLVEPYTIAAGTPRQTTLAAGSVVFASIASAMHDAAVVTDPETFKPGRPAYHYLHLGFGEHLCLGDQVSLMQAPELAKQIIKAGFVKRAAGAAGRLDFKGGPFPESLILTR